MSKAFEVLFQFFKPVILVATGLASVVSFLLGALANPQGLWNQICVAAIDFVAQFFPSTPTEYTIGSVIDSIAVKMPLVGRGIIYEIFQVILVIAGLELAIKVYKLIPFKAT